MKKFQLSACTFATRATSSQTPRKLTAPVKAPGSASSCFWRLQCVREPARRACTGFTLVLACHAFETLFYRTLPNSVLPLILRCVVCVCACACVQGVDWGYFSWMQTKNVSEDYMPCRSDLHISEYGRRRFAFARL